jgi:hypothetical protein
MKSKLFILITVLMVIFSFAVHSMVNAGELTESSVKALMEKVDSVALTKDTSKLSDAMSDNVLIIMNVNMQGENHVRKLAKKEYLSMVQQGLDMYKDYKYKKSNMVIKIEGNRAIVTADISESMTVQGKEISGETKEETTIELVNGKLLITKIVGYTTM